MKERIHTMKTPQELVVLLKQLPEREQLRVEGVIVGLSLAHAEQARDGERRDSA